jgi:hypothetical protein
MEEKRGRSGSAEGARIEELAGSLSRQELLDLGARILRAARDGSRSVDKTRPRERGGPKDTVIQKAAAMEFLRLYEVEGLSFEEIGAIFGVSRERIRQLFVSLGIHPKDVEEFGKELRK